MSIERALACLILLAAAPVGAAQDEALALLQDALDPPLSAYEGQLTVTAAAGPREDRHWLSVRYSPPGFYRRETLDRFGTPERVAVSDGETEWVYDRRTATAWRGAPADREHRLGDPDEELALLADNYALALGADEPVAGRPCRVLEVTPRRGGPVAQRLWVDAEENLVLQRVVYAADGAESSRMRFERVAFHPAGRREDYRFRPPAATRVVYSRPAPDALELEEAAKATDLAPRPPAWLPPGYVFESVGLLPYRGATILHYRWSDGVDVLSLFQAPARSRVRPPAGGEPRPATVGALPARLTLSSEGKSLEWASGDRFVLLGRLGLDELRKVAESVPPR